MTAINDSPEPTIIDRLRDLASWDPGDGEDEGYALLREAADEIERLQAGLRKIRQKRERYISPHDAGTPASEWSNGYGTALATVSLLVSEHLEPDDWAEHEADMAASGGTDREWFERTGNCGRCGNPAGYCGCTPDDPCGCGPHERATEDLACSWCKGTGVFWTADNGLTRTPKLTHQNGSKDER